MKQRVLFVCLGNICRSPAAQGIFETILQRHDEQNLYHIDSAGTYAGHRGELPDSRMRSAARKRGVVLTHRSRPVRFDDFEEFDYIIAMDDSNYDNLKRMAPSVEAAEKIYKMATFIDLPEVDHIPDPYYQGHEGFEYVLDLLEKGCESLYRKISQPK